MKAERCQAVTKSGKPCSARPVDDAGLCAWHSPAWAERRREWSAKGGAQRSNQQRAKKRLPTSTLAPIEIQGLLGVALRDVLAGRVEPGIANAAANLARALVTVREASEVEERLSALEGRAGLSEGRIA